MSLDLDTAFEETTKIESAMVQRFLVLMKK